jgi:hypothetical protein
VKVYVTVPAAEVFIVAGLHVPMIAGIFVELAGKDGGMEFWHNGPICVNTGVILVDTTISIVVVAAHWPASGVKVYVTVPAEEVLIAAGLHVPVMAGIFVELAGKDGGTEFRHSGPICVNVGGIEVVTSIPIVVITAH